VLRSNRLARNLTELITVESGGITDKAQILRAYLAREALAPAHVVMVGDRSSDVDAAVAVGCHFIGCDYGHGYRSEIEGAGPVCPRSASCPAPLQRSSPPCDPGKPGRGVVTSYLCRAP